MIEPIDASEHGIESCFVISPIGDKLAPFGSDERKRYEEAIQIWDYVIEPACQASNIEPVRSDRISEPGEITEQAFVRLRDDDLVIADVTGGNPNVMYELGLRHTTNKLTIQLGERERLPFDITVIRTIQFIRTETGLVEARDALIQAIRASVEHGGSPVTATRVWLGLHDHPPAIAEIEVPQEPEEDEGPGFLDMVAEAEDAMPLLAQVVEELGALFEELPTLTNTSVAEMEASDARGGGAGGRLLIAQKFAKDLEEPTARMEQLAADFLSQLERIDPGISHLISEVEEDPSLREDEDARKFIDSITQMADAAEQGLGEIGTLASAVGNLGRISNRLRPVSRRMSTALRRIAGSRTTMQEWGRRLRAVDEGSEEARQ
jgi:hypothetical protein